MSAPQEIPIFGRRLARIPDESLIARHLHEPEFGPRILFFSGGSALRETCRVLKHHTHNSIHLITPFDSGGSSAVLREAFGMLGVGDLRNRLMSLADETEHGNPNVKALFSHRFEREGDLARLSFELDALVAGEHPLMRAVPQPMRRIIRTHLTKFALKMPEGFELRGACIGNLILAGGFLALDRDFDSVLYLFSKLVSARGTVRPTTFEPLSLVAVHESGQRTCGQHRFGETDTRAHGTITDLELTQSATGGAAIQAQADEVSLQMLEGAELICFPMGSFFGSVLANLLPAGVGRTIGAASCPKVFIPNVGVDPEMAGYSLSSATQKILDFVRRDAGAQTAASRILDFVLLDSVRGHYDFELDFEALASIGVRTIDTALVGADPDRIDPQRLVEVLLSLA